MIDPKSDQMSSLKKLIHPIHEKGLVILVPCIMVIVFFLQIFLVNFYDLSPWKGGGFGMFSTTDHGGHRGLSCEAIDNNDIKAKCLVDFSDRNGYGEFNRAKWKRIRSFPLQSDLKELAQYYLNAQIEIKGSNPTFESYRLALQDKLKNKDVLQKASLKGVRFRMWKLKFDPGTLRVWTEEMGIETKIGKW